MLSTSYKCIKMDSNAYVNYIIVLIFGLVIKIVTSQCILKIPEDFPEAEPIYLQTNKDLWNPEGPRLEWKRGESTYIACSGSHFNNNLNITGDAVAITCIQGKNFTVKGNSFSGKEIGCTSYAKASVQRTASETKCTNGGILLNIGFPTTIQKDEFVKYFEICFNYKIASAVYAHHWISGKAIQHTEVIDTHRTFHSDGYPLGVKPKDLYMQASTRQRINELTGDLEIAEKYKKTFLTRGHLAPDADGIFKTFKLATYFYVNVAPMWETINGGNWERVEAYARQQALDLNNDLEVFTGTHGVFQLPNRDGRMRPFYLSSKNKIVVPEWIWKIIIYGDTGIAFVTYNNPYAEPNAPPCLDICETNGWKNKNFAHFKSGKTFCCDVNKIKEEFPSIPKDVFVAQVMKRLHKKKKNRKRGRNFGN